MTDETLYEVQCSFIVRAENPAKALENAGICMEHTDPETLEVSISGAGYVSGYATAREVKSI